LRWSALHGTATDGTESSGKLAAAVFVGVYIVGSILVFVAKTLTLRITAKTMPEYHASLGGDQRGWR
jgi:hypothetical protein